jgi:hypothetical protein
MKPQLWKSNDGGLLAAVGNRASPRQAMRPPALRVPLGGQVKPADRRNFSQLLSGLLYPHLACLFVQHYETFFYIFNDFWSVLYPPRFFSRQS